jgi:hypothetical protein
MSDLSSRFLRVFFAVVCYTGTAMSKEPSDYYSGLLRLWREDGKDQASWRASLESSLTGTRHAFLSLEELFLFLRRQVVSGSDATTDKGMTRCEPPPTPE